jgi:hypothetical protein
MSTTIAAFDGHVGLYSGAVSGAGERLIGLQVENTRRISPIATASTMSGVCLTRAQAVAVALELLERATDPPMRESIRLRVADVFPELAGPRS